MQLQKSAEDRLALASHKGGATERMIRSVRRVLLAVTSDHLLTDEQLSTAMCEAERVVNDRPLTVSSDDPRDLEVLTPSKLLLLRSNSCLPLGTFKQDDRYGTRWWRQAQHVANVFWRRWTKEYLPTLHERRKWREERKSVKQGDVVLVGDFTLPRGQWPLARVIEATPGRDGLVRSATVLCRDKKIRRPITKLYMLEEA